MTGMIYYVFIFVGLMMSLSTGEVNYLPFNASSTASASSRITSSLSSFEAVEIKGCIDYSNRHLEAVLPQYSYTI